MNISNLKADLNKCLLSLEEVLAYLSSLEVTAVVDEGALEVESSLSIIKDVMEVLSDYETALPTIAIATHSRAQ